MSGPIRRGGSGKFPFRSLPPMAPPGETIELGAPQINFVRQVAKVAELPMSAILNMAVDAAAYHGKAARLDTLFAAWISQAETQQAAAAQPADEPAAEEETVAGTAEERLKAQREAAGMTPESPGAIGGDGVGVDPVTVPAEALGLASEPPQG